MLTLSIRASVLLGTLALRIAGPHADAKVPATDLRKVRRSMFPITTSLLYSSKPAQASLKTRCFEPGFHYERALQWEGRRGTAHHHIECSWNYRPVHVKVQQHQILGRQCETDRLAFSGLEGDPLETVQLFDSSGQRRKALVNV